MILLFGLSANVIINTERLYKRDNQSRLFELDSGGYFNYLPATFVYHQDYDFSYIEKHNFPSNFLSRIDNHSFNKYGIGVAVLQAPFYGITHLVTSSKNKFPADGFSQPYQHSIMIGAIFYGLLGLYFLRKVLLTIFSDVVVAVTLVVICFGSNLLYYSTFEPCMSHIYSFFLFSVGLFLTDLFWKKEKPVHFLVLSLVIGLILLVRIPNLVFMIVPLLWKINSRSTFTNRVQAIWRNKAVVLIGFLLVCCFASAQAYVYRHQLGAWFVSPYTNEGFLWDQPMFGRVLFSYRKGWLVYSPLMVFSIVGLWQLFKRHKSYILPITSFFVINLYVISCWWNWWYGGGYGMRALVESMAVMALPLAAMIEYLFSKKTLSYLFTAILPLLICYNFLNMHQYKHGIIHYDSMTKASYWAIFGATHPAADEVMKKRNDNLVFPHFEYAKDGKQERAKIK